MFHQRMKFEFSKDQFSQLQPDKIGNHLAISVSPFVISCEKCTKQYLFMVLDIYYQKGGNNSFLTKKIPRLEVENGGMVSLK